MDTEALKPDEERQNALDTCIACLEDIRSNASKCSHCGASQKSWLNWLHTITAVGILPTLVATGVVAIIAISTGMWERIFWKDDLTVISYQSDGQVCIRNSGDGQLFVEHILVKSDDLLRYRRIRFIGETVAKSSFLCVNSAGRAVGHRFDGQIVKDMPDHEWESIKRGEVPGFSPYILSKDHLIFRQMSLGTRPRTFKAECEVSFHSVLKENLVKQPFPCLGVFIRSGRSPVFSSD